MPRLLAPECIPQDMWNASDDMLIIPQELGDAFARVVERNNLEALLGTGVDDGPIGGPTQGETDVHFVNRLDGSIARVQLVILDPKHELDTASDTLVARLSGGTTCIADAPCGAGAGVLSALAVIASLRRRDILPRVPLDIRLVGADISARARELAQEMLDEMAPVFAQQAINVSVEWVPWDATDVASNTNLVRRVIVASDACKMRLLLVANFSGFLTLPGKTSAADPQLEELFRYFAGPECAALWLEPVHNPATKPGGMMDWLIKRVREKWRRFAKLPVALEGKLGFVSRASFRTVIRGGKARVTACVVPMVLEPENEN